MTGRMIPATSIAFQDDGTAWLYVEADPDQYSALTRLVKL